MTDYCIAPSILSADLACLGEDTRAVLDAGADIVHFDVMDNHYVPNLTFGPIVVEALRKYGINAPIDVHLMIKPVDRIIPDFASAGATYITFHPEASDHIDRSLQLIRDNERMQNTLIHIKNYTKIAAADTTGTWRDAISNLATNGLTKPK